MPDDVFSKLFDECRNYYASFFLEGCCGNNAFSYEARQTKRLFVAPLVSGNLGEVEAGTETAFCEMVDGKERASVGLKNFVYVKHDGKDIFIFDNHNHAFVFWSLGIMAGRIQPGGRMIHVDQHKDTRAPVFDLPTRFWETVSMQEVCEYANQVLNVGNFIKPALSSGMFGEVSLVDSQQAFDETPAPTDVLDLDLDIFSPDMNYIAHDQKRAFIQQALAHAKLVTIATSPYFIGQAEAIRVVRVLLGTGDSGLGIG